MAEQPRHILMCSCEDTMPLDADARRSAAAAAREVTTAASSAAPSSSDSAPRRPAASRSSSAAPRKRRCSPRSPRRATARSRFVNIRETAGWSTRRRQGRAEDGGAARGRRRARCPTFPSSASTSEGVILIYGRDEQAIEAGRPAQGSSRRHRADHAAGRRRAAARHRVPGGEGHDPLRQGPSRRVRADGRRLCRSRRRRRAAR